MPDLTTTAEAMLAERVYQACLTEAPSGHHSSYDMLAKQPLGSDGENLTEFEQDLRDWGFTYGVAYALARLDADAFEPPSRAAERAYEAAWAAYRRWANGFARREGLDGSREVS